MTTQMVLILFCDIGVVVRIRSLKFQILVLGSKKQTGSNHCSSSPCLDLCVPIPNFPYYACLCSDGREWIAGNSTCSGWYWLSLYFTKK